MRVCVHKSARAWPPWAVHACTHAWEYEVGDLLNVVKAPEAEEIEEDGGDPLEPHLVTTLPRPNLVREVLAEQSRQVCCDALIRPIVAATERVDDRDVDIVV